MAFARDVACIALSSSSDPQKDRTMVFCNVHGMEANGSSFFYVQSVIICARCHLPSGLPHHLVCEADSGVYATSDNLNLHLRIIDDAYHSSARRGTKLHKAAVQSHVVPNARLYLAG